MSADTILKDAAIYCRVSTDDQSCDRQLRDLLAFASRAGYAVDEAHIFKETASGMKHDREQRLAVLQLARSRKIKAVIVTEMTRWGRSLPDLLDTLKELNAYGVSLVAETGLQFDVSTPQGKMLAGVLGSLAEFERDLIAERVKSGMANARAKGKQLGRPKGNHTDAKHRKAVLTLTEQGFSIRDIATKLKISKDTVGRIQRANVM
jgi:putative DNA-invertase from lambdoid prophage Rac